MMSYPFLFVVPTHNYIELKINLLPPPTRQHTITPSLSKYYNYLHSQINAKYENGPPPQLTTNHTSIVNDLVSVVKFIDTSSTDNTVQYISHSFHSFDIHADMCIYDEYIYLTKWTYYLAHQSIGRTIIFRIDDICKQYETIYMLSSIFCNMYVYKSMDSNWTNTECYLICCSFKGLPTAFHSKSVSPSHPVISFSYKSAIAHINMIIGQKIINQLQKQRGML